MSLRNQSPWQSRAPDGASHARICPCRASRCGAGALVLLLFSILTPVACKRSSPPQPGRLSAAAPRDDLPGAVPSGRELPPLSDTEVWQRWASGRVPHYDVPEQRMPETHRRLAHLFNAIAAARVNFIDVGCSRGDYLVRLQQAGIRKPIYSIGIDPLDVQRRTPYSKYLRVAVANRAPGRAAFHVYGHDGATSSLSKMKTGHLTHSPEEQEKKFYHPEGIETERGTIVVDVVPLSRIVEQHGLSGEVLHYVKIDVQGTDLDAFLSLNRHAQRVLAVQLESIYSARPTHRLYEGQQMFAEEAKVLRRLGFRVFNVARFPAGPEADVTWVNEKLLLELAPSGWSLRPNRSAHPS